MILHSLEQARLDDVVAEPVDQRELAIREERGGVLLSDGLEGLQVTVPHLQSFEVYQSPACIYKADSRFVHVPPV